MRRPAAAAVVATTVLASAAAFGASAAVADPQAPSATAETAAHGHGLFIDGLGLNVAGSARSASEFPGAAGPDAHGLDIDLLETLEVSAGQVDIPLLAAGENGGLLSLGDLGALSSYSAAPSATSSVASSGIITDDGAIDLGRVDDTENFAPASVNASSLVREVLGDEVADALLDDATLNVGALASRVEAQDGVALPEYALSGLDLEVSSPLVAGLVDDLDELTGTLIEPVETALDGGSVQQAAADVVNGVDALPLVDASLNSLELDTSTLTTELRAQLLRTPLMNTDGSVSVDLSDGTIGVDLDRLVIAGAGSESLSELAPNTEVLDDRTINAILDGVSDALLGDGPNSLVTHAASLIDAGVSGVGVTLDLEVGLSADLGAATISVADGPLRVSGTLGGILDGEGASPFEVDVSGITLLPDLPVPVSLGALLQPVVNAVTDEVSGLGGALSESISGVLDDVAPEVSELVAPLVTALLDDALEPVLTEVLSITINAQPSLVEGGESDLGPEGFTVRALSVTLLPLLGDAAVDVELGSSTVFPAEPAATATLTAAPNPVAQGGEVTLTGTGFDGGEEVSVTFPDGTTTPVTASGDGSISSTWDVPADFPLGDATFTATGGTSGDSATTTTEVIAAPSATATLSATPNPVEQGGTVTLTGGGFDGGEDVEVTLPGGSSTTETADENGSFTTTWEVPADFEPGTASFEATGAVSGLTATATTVVEAAAGGNVNASASASASADAAADDAATASAQAAAQAAANADNSSDASAAADVSADAAAAVAANANASSEASAQSQAAAAAAAQASADSTAASASNADASAAASAAANGDASAAASAASQAAAEATSSADASAAASGDLSGAADGAASDASAAAAGSDASAAGSASAGGAGNAAGGPNQLVTTGGSSPLALGAVSILLLLAGAGVVLAAHRRKTARRG